MKEKQKQSWRTWKSGKRWITTSGALLTLIAVGTFGVMNAPKGNAETANGAVKTLSNSSNSLTTLKGSNLLTAAKTNQTNFTSEKEAAPVPVTVNNADELDAAIVKAVKAGEDCHITLAGPIKGGNHEIHIPSGRTVKISGGAIEQENGASLHFVVEDKATLELENVSVDYSKAISASVDPFSNGQGTVILSGNTKFTGGDKQGNKQCALDMQSIVMKDNASIENWPRAIRLGRSDGSTLDMTDNSRLSNNTTGIYVTKNSHIKLDKNAKISNSKNVAVAIVAGENVTIEGGNYQDNQQVVRDERVNDGSLNIHGVNFQHNIMSSDSKSPEKGIVETSKHTKASIENCTFSYNSGGSALRLKGAQNTISQSLFTQNSTPGYGAAIYFESQSKANIINSQFTQNHSKKAGGAIALKGDADHAADFLDLRNVLFESNSAPEGGGAIGFYNYDATNNAIHEITADKDTRFVDNSADRLTRVSDKDQAIHDSKILGSRFSALDNAYNNYDIEYTGGEVARDNIVTICYHSNGGNIILDSIEEKGVLARKPKDPEKLGFKFGGWYVDQNLTKIFNFEKDPIFFSDKMNKTLDLYAKWIPNNNEYSVNFNSNGGSPVSGIKVKSDTLLEKPAEPTRSGFTFAGWYKDAKLKTPWNFKTDKVTGDLTLYAKWTPKAVETVPVYRLYNSNTGEHFYTTSAFERDQDIKSGWTSENILEYAPKTGKAVYRLYNPNVPGGDHYYTLSKFEANSLVKLGWKWDNDGKPIFYSGGKKPVYVAYNPNAKSGTHSYTTSAFEQQSLLKIGWTFGSTAWYAEK